MRLRSFLNLVVLLGMFHVYIGMRLLPALTFDTSGRVVGSLLLGCSCLLMPLAMMTRGARNRARADALAWVGMIAMGVFSSLLVLTLVRDVVLLLMTWL